MSSNLKLVSSHLDLVSLISLNLKRVTYPLELGQQAKEIDYPMLRQFEQALRPPRPIRALEDAPRELGLRWQRAQQREEAEYASITRAAPSREHAGTFDQSEIRGLISQRLDNLSMRVMRMDTLETISEAGPDDVADPSIKSLLQRLRDMRDQIGGAVGIMNRSRPQNAMDLAVSEPEGALRQELEAWNLLEERIEREILHPPPRLGTLASSSVKSVATSKPMDIPKARPPHPVSPRSYSYDGWPGPGYSSSPDHHRASLSSSPNLSRPLTHSRSHSTSSASGHQAVRLERDLPVDL